MVPEAERGTALGWALGVGREEAQARVQGEARGAVPAEDSEAGQASELDWEAGRGWGSVSGQVWVRERALAGDSGPLGSSS